MRRGLRIRHHAEKEKTMGQADLEQFLRESDCFYSKNYPGSKETRAAKDFEMIQERMRLYDEIEGPRVGDFVRMPDGELHRFTYDWEDGLQTGKGGSYYLAEGYIDYSGSLDPRISRERLRDTGEKRLGHVWVFSGNHHTAHNGVEAQVLFRVFEVIG